MKNLLQLLVVLLASITLTAQNAPVDFETGGQGSAWTWTVFENDDNPPVQIVTNPDATGINTSATVGEFTARLTGQPYAGTESMHGADIGAFTLSSANSLIKIMVWKTTISDVGIKLVENSGAALPEIKVANTVTNQWEELTFNFSSMEGTEFDQIVIFPDFTARAQENVIYFDNIVFDMQDPNNIDGCTDPTASNYNSSATTDDGSCLYSMTFNVNMECEIGTFTQVEITGPFTGWCSGCIILDDSDGDDIYSITLDVPAGSLEYKYSIDNFAGQENLVDDVAAGVGACAPITDGATFANRLVTVGAGAIFDDTYGTCGVCDPNNITGCMDSDAANYDPNATVDSGLCSYAVTFSVDMNDVILPFTTPEVNGTFNGWCGNCNAMSDTDGDGIWETTINLPSATYDFKFSADAWSIEEMLTEGLSCTETTDGFTNRKLIVGDSPQTYGPAAWEACVIDCPQDLTGDGQVDVNDFLEFNSAFGDICTGCPADFDNSGVVDINDFLDFNSAFGPCN